MTKRRAVRDGLERAIARWVSVAPIRNRFPVGSGVSVFPLDEVFTVTGWLGAPRGEVKVRHTGTGCEFHTKAWRLRQSADGGNGDRSGPKL